MEKTTDKKAQVTPNIKSERIVIYRVSRLCPEDECWYEEQLVRYALSAWFMNVDRAMARLKRGEKVYTPYAYYVARTV